MSLVSYLRRNAGSGVRSARRLVDDRRRRHYRDSLGRPSEKAREILTALESDGAYITSFDALKFASSPSLKASATEVAQEMAQREAAGADTTKAYVVHAQGATLDARPEMIRWGLEELLLDVAERYMGAPVAYRGLTFRRELPDGQKLDTRLWHLDAEDRRIIKAIVYLNDVTMRHGPFEYIPKSVMARSPNPRMIAGRVTDEDMAAAVPESFWRPCVGPAGTVVIVDTCSVYHRGRLPELDRYALFFAYNSKSPLQPQYCAALFDRERLTAGEANLSPRQKLALQYDY